MNTNFKKFINERVQYRFWNDKNNLQKEVDKYKTRSEFAINNYSAYNAAIKRNLMDELFKNHDNQGYNENREKDGYWSKERLQEEANKYQTRKHFRKNNKSAYSAAKRKKVLDEIFKNHHNNGYLDKEEWKEKSYVIYAYELKKFNKVYVGLTNNMKRRDIEHLWSEKTKLGIFCKECSIPIPKYKILEENLNSKEAQIKEDFWVQYYKDNNWEIFNVAKPGTLGCISSKWTLKKLQKEADKYQTRGELLKNNLKAYNAASDHKILDEIFKNHPNQGRTKNKWTKEILQQEADKYKSRKEFKDNNQKAYNMAKEYKIMNDLFKNHYNRGYQN